MERLNCKKDSEILENEENILHLRHWASLRGQTLSRTGSLKALQLLPSSFMHLITGINTVIAVRGMMYYRRALKLQAFLDMASESGKHVHVKIFQ